MKENEFTVDYWEDAWDTVRIPQRRDAEDIHEFHRILTQVLPKGDLSLIEVGCAPGSWITYFHNCFHYSVSGIEYAPRAYEKTVENLRIQDVSSEIFQGDFFEFKHAPYDVVFSSGFIEHFEDPAPVVERITNLCDSNGGFVVTIIPSMQGVTRWISKTFRPRVAAGHFPITKHQLIRYHEQCGLETHYCNYVGSLRVLVPIGKNNFAKTHPSLSGILNLPFRVWNRLVSMSTKKTGIYPKLSFLTDSIIYIGKR